MLAFRRLQGCSLRQRLGQAPLTLWAAKQHGTQQYALSHVGATDHDVPIPLCLREAVHEHTMQELISWRTVALAAIDDVGDQFEKADDGPSAAELSREVDWVLDDALAQYEKQGDHWETITWKQLNLELHYAQRRNVDTSNWRVRTRASTSELQVLWKQRLQDRTPFQYLISAAHWRQYILSVGPGVLIPRPETELMIDLAQQAVGADPRLAGLPWVDLGTGSGAIAIGVADMLRGVHAAARVYAVDISSTAAAYATYNSRITNTQDAISVCQGSWYEPVQHLKGQLGGIISNPPYIPKVEMYQLQAEVGRHEPWGALDGGEGPGLDSLKVICEGALEMLAPGGFLALETAAGQQAEQVAALLKSCTAQPEGFGFTSVTVVPDCYGKTRFVTASRQR